MTTNQDIFDEYVFISNDGNKIFRLILCRFYAFRKGNQKSFGRRLKLSSRLCIENIQKRGKIRHIAE